MRVCMAGRAAPLTRIAMEHSGHGCGHEDTKLILYEVFPFRARALTEGFEHLRCGYRPNTVEVHSYGILLCPDCAAKLDFPAST